MAGNGHFQRFAAYRNSQLLLERIKLGVVGKVHPHHGFE